MLRVVINGFGRIGRSVLRALYEDPKRDRIKIVAINELAQPEAIAHLLQYDSTHGRFAKRVSYDAESLSIHHGDQVDTIQILSCKEIESLALQDLGVDLVLDCTGVFGCKADGEKYLAAGAKKVLFSHPGSHDLDNTIIYGVNQQSLQQDHHFVSNGSCTTNCIVPIISVLDEAFGIESGSVTTIHSAMNDQQVIDSYHSDLRKTRAASQSIIPIDTKIHKGIERIFPKLTNKFEAISVRVPTMNVSAIDLTIITSELVDINKINSALKEAAQSSLINIVSYTEAPLVSVDFNHDPHSAIVDGSQTRVSNGHLVKMLIWFDNEWGFANRMLDTSLAMFQEQLSLSAVECDNLKIHCA